VTPFDLLVDTGLLRALDLLGVLVMALAGGEIASRLRFDPVGYAAIGVVSGLGGGILRDLILDVGVPAAFSGPWYLVCALGGAGISYVVRAEGRLWGRLVLTMDSLGLGLWAATGTAKSLAYGLDPLPAILLGVLTAVGGGALRDVMVGRVPTIFGGGVLYATNALVTAVTTWIVVAIGLPSWSVLGPVALGALLAVLSAWRGWGLPQENAWQVTLSPAQLKALMRRVRRSERRRIAIETGAIPVVHDVDDPSSDDPIGPGPGIPADPDPR
jgi:uncharacterized membrane protein YeiH